MNCFGGEVSETDWNCQRFSCHVIQNVCVDIHGRNEGRVGGGRGVRDSCVGGSMMASFFLRPTRSP
eukprot:scaffold23647_cov51-Attheya_sp.AAC.2